MSRTDWDVVIVGSGFSGSLLARILARGGWRVLVVDRTRHPRFAIGESTTPLANLSLERLARGHGLDNMWALAAYGRWLDAYPEVRRGLKRGFSFYLQTPDRLFRPGPSRRLLVAASPNDRVADTHWLRADVDALLAGWAVEDGAEIAEETRIEGIESSPEGLRLELRGGGASRVTTAGLAIDASGASAAVASRLGATSGPPLRTKSALVYGHFEGVGELGGAVEDPRALDDAPYPEDRAAVHHLLEEGWGYLLAFDHGVTSAGLLLDDTEPAGAVAPQALWQSVIDRYPTLTTLFEGARPVFPLRSHPRLQRRLSRSHGPRWVATPHTYGFVDPFFSTGIAWSLRAVERLAEVLLGTEPGDEAVVSGRAFDRYSSLLAAEIEQIDRLVAAAYRARRRLDLFAPHSLLYFARVSFAESLERLGRPEGACWRGLLGAGEPEAEAHFRESGRRVEAALAGEEEVAGYEDWVARTIEPFDVAGLADAGRGNLYPAEIDTLERNAAKLGIPDPPLGRRLVELKAESEA